MGNDYNWYSTQNVRVATEGLRESGRKWHGLADRMASVSSTAARQHLDQSAFSVVIDGPVGSAATSDLQDAYQQQFDRLNRLFAAAVEQFDAMGAALKRNADWYEDADADSAQSFDGIAAGDWPH
ncbi:hypothetical protein ACWT_1360 [Actinoplanes sp. SE50]|uniref:WXG100 family type VII secretion target n=1 Tax=unclassified Actinoplanes TaxID=2626549 RepID=UPI00023EBE98|nr:MULTISPECIES: type VII secretion target [unclassified Actinoplanes]AEV82378.1 hypothetical protein ACPL_1481 [Actinoplanes sp. SE50/110]ATO80775.1 hypothetical protein ACWT_1360 [Actinoplanes sp. SE50]SLL98183.1 hypothetical protein ACSP50_1407 [Actinoplanes sp. SE50/110]